MRKPEGVLRIFSLGNSHTQGFEVRQDFTYSAVIAKYLNARGRTAEVLNTGVSGFSTAEELVFLENEGIKCEPEVVVLGFYANDYEDNLKAGLFRLGEDGSLSIERKAHIPGVRIQNFAIPTKDDVSDYEVEVTSALLKRMYEFCHDRSIPLIIIDIPKISGDGIASSFNPSMRSMIYGQSDGFIDSASLLADYSAVTELHRPHGHRHISEFTHVMLGLAAAKQIEPLLQ